MNQLLMGTTYFAPFLVLLQMVSNQVAAPVPIVTVEKPAIVEEVPEEPSSTQSDVEPIPTRPTSQKELNKQIVKLYTIQYFGESEVEAMNKLVMKESGFNNNAQNKKSTAFGMAQFLDSTWQGTGIKKTSDPIQQAEAMCIYIRNRYGSPSKTLQFHQANGWY